MVRTKILKSGEITAYSEVAFRNNNAIVEYCRTSASALSGCTAGTMGLTGFQGFAFYFCAVIVLWCLLLLKAGPSWEKYFVNRMHLLTNGFFGGLFTYVLFWTFLFGMVHVY